MSNIPIVQDFIASICRNNKDEILAFFTDNARYHNIPLKPCIGKDAIWKELAVMQEHSSAIEWPIHNIGESAEGVVFTERLDRFQMNGKWLEIPVMGVFELENGKITGRRDYFDLQTITSQLS